MGTLQPGLGSSLNSTQAQQKGSWKGEKIASLHCKGNPHFILDSAHIVYPGNQVISKSASDALVRGLGEGGRLAI